MKLQMRKRRSSAHSYGGITTINPTINASGESEPRSIRSMPRQTPSAANMTDVAMMRKRIGRDRFATAAA
jgi:hypothetical protein